MRRIRERLRTEMRSLRGANAQAVIARFNPIIRGWAAYYRTVVASETFTSLDHYLWKLTYKWAKHSHPNKPTRWIVHRYFGKFHKSRQDQWVFGDRDSGAYLHRFAWTKIVRHQMVRGTSSPDDPALAEYWLPGGAGEYPAPSTRPPCGSCSRSTAAAHAAGNFSWTPTARRKPQVNGNNGWRPPARR